MKGNTNKNNKEFEFNILAFNVETFKRIII